MSMMLRVGNNGAAASQLVLLLDGLSMLAREQLPAGAWTWDRASRYSSSWGGQHHYHTSTGAVSAHQAQLGGIVPWLLRPREQPQLGGQMGGSARHRNTLVQPRSLAVPMDAILLERQLTRAQSLEDLVSPVLQHGDLLNATQITRSLRRLPLMMASRRRHSRPVHPVSMPLEHLQLPVVLLVGLAQQLQSKLPLCTPQQVADGLWGMAMTARHIRLPKPSADAPRPHVRHLPAVQSLCAAATTHLLAVAPTMPLRTLALASWSLAAVQPTPAFSDSMIALMRVAEERVVELSPEAAAEALGWRGIAQLTCAAEQGRARGSELARVLTAATVHTMQQHLQAHTGGAGVLLPRCVYQYRTISGVKTSDQPLTPKASAYQRRDSLLPRVLIQDFTPATLTPVLRALYALHPRGELAPALLSTATAYLLATLPSRAPASGSPASPTAKAVLPSTSGTAAGGGARVLPRVRPTLPPAMLEGGTPAAAAEAAARGWRFPVPGLKVPPAPAALTAEWTSQRRYMPVAHAVKLLQLLDLEQPADWPRLAERLLVTVASTPRAATEHLLQGLTTAAALRLDWSNPGTQQVMQRVCSTINLPMKPAKSGRDGALPVLPAPAGSAHGEGSSVVAAATAVQASSAPPLLSPSQLASLASCVVHLRCTGPMIDALGDALLSAAQRTDDTAWTPRDVALFTCALVHLPVVAHGPLVTGSARRQQLRKFEKWMDGQVPTYGGYGAVLCAAALASWKAHESWVLAKVASRALNVPDSLRDQKDELVDGWVRRLTPALRDRLAVKLLAALPNHALLPYLYAAGAPQPAGQPAEAANSLKGGERS